MFEEKLNIEFVPVKNVKFEFQEQYILLTPYFSLKDKIIFISDYVNYLFADGDEDIAIKYLVAEQSLMLDIIDKYTNVKVDDVNFDSLIASGLWNQIKSKFVDYEEFRKDLQTAIDMKKFEKKLEKSIGAIVETISDKIAIALQKVSEMDVDSLRETTQDFSNKLEELNNAVPGILGKPATNRGKRKKSANDPTKQQEKTENN